MLQAMQMRDWLKRGEASAPSPEDRGEGREDSPIRA